MNASSGGRLWFYYLRLEHAEYGWHGAAENHSRRSAIGVTRVDNEMRRKQKEEYYRRRTGWRQRFMS